MEQKGEDLIIRIPEFEEYVKLSESRRAKYKKNPDGSDLLDGKGKRILANPRVAGTPRFKKISGQDMYSGMNQHTRAKMIGFIKEYLYSHFKGANKITTYPLQIEMIVKQTLTVHKLNRIKNKWEDTGMNWDLDNFTLIWRKAFADAICGNVSYVKRGDGTGKKKFQPNYDKYPPIIEDDSTKYVVAWHEKFKPVDTPEERELIFIITPFNANEGYYAKV